ncbi:MAG: Dickkopf N-terminal cysteine-rich domain-containing protein [Deltaproteobacteria bacterium]|nr:Dickkopf N-terminal cysteine-rich domain-containing protein [Deltaproteobacteria bacterium]
MMKSIYAIAVSVTFTLTGCWAFGGGGGKGEEDGPVPVEQMGQEVASVFCGLIDRCIGPGFFGGNDCQGAMQAQFEDTTEPQLQAAIDRGTLAYDGDKMRECIDAMSAAGCEAIGSDEPPAACEQAMAGNVAPEGTCYIDEECAGDAFCSQDMACPGMCESYLPAQADCTMGGRCTGSTTCVGGVCTPLAQAGQPCGGEAHPYCANGLDCEGESWPNPGTCVAQPTPTLAGADQACDPEARQLCQAGLSCSLIGLEGGEIPIWECKPGVASGATCNYGLPDPCPSTEYCAGQIDPSNLTGTCTALPGENAACADTFMGEGCQPGLECVDGICFRSKRIGESCSGEWECVSGFCAETSMQCAVPECG